ncbi:MULTISPECIES: NUDIX domain-containing protein [unclassified Fusibacter]|uniref:NUDIX hydrolase n=1 Tax=unclassified Fusibacter TaxID=2624464 RepID=UPI00101357AA|nr:MULTISPECIES: NUDIX domain-containing protein [unclassified Fusibacter]MCK8058226.1 NUDIX domain-containing protein [Fusibacter sp. A2]NPE20809.1 NUDIX domain-containing protein [Fusibacter sp. A1]RXV63013.1 NUDIX domain-containing protein [Fusibacter sp. A1]
MEYWDLYNEKREPLGRTMLRAASKPKGEYHVVVDIWTFNSNAEVLVTLRDHVKEYYPGYWENTSGSSQAGETSLQAAIRELHEETGIRVTAEDLTYLGTFVEEAAFVDTYALCKDVPIHEIQLQEHETIDAKWIDLESLNEMVEKQIIAPPIIERFNPIKEKLFDLIDASRSSDHD